MNDDNEVYEQIRELIGAEGADKLTEAFGGSSIYIPSIRSTAIVNLHKTIRQEYKDGKSYRELSSSYGYSVAHIRNIIHRKS